MSFLSALRRKPEEDLYDYENDYEYDEDYDERDRYDDRYDDRYAYDSYDNYEPEERSWNQPQGVQPIQSVADMQVVLVAPKKYEDASKIADLLRDLKFVVLNLADTEQTEARRLLDFISGVVYTEDGNIMKIATNVYAVAPYFVDLLGDRDESLDLYRFG